MKEILKIYLFTTQDPVFGYTDKKSIDSDLAAVKTHKNFGTERTWGLIAGVIKGDRNLFCQEE